MLAVHRRSNGMGCRSNRSSHPFRKNFQPFEPFKLSIQKKLPAIRTARAIRSKKIANRSNGSGYPFRKNCQPFERLGLFIQKNCQPFERIELSIQNKRATVWASTICSAARVEQLCQIKKAFNSIRRYVALQMKICVVYKHVKNITITVPFLLLSYLSIIDKRFIQDLSFIQSSWLLPG